MSCFHLRLNLAILILVIARNAVNEAISIKAQYPISFVDGFATACAIKESAVLVTGDPEIQVSVPLSTALISPYPLDWGQMHIVPDTKAGNHRGTEGKRK